MTQTAIKISGLNEKITVPVLQSNFSMVGPVLKVDLYDDLKSKKCAELTFENESLALKAIEEFNGKQLLKSQVKVELIKVNLDKERIGEVIFPIAKKLHAQQAAKLTGMIVEAIINLKESRTRSEIQEILSSEKFVSELVEAASKKLNVRQ